VKKKPEHYVDNQLFLKELTAYRTERFAAKRDKKDLPQIPEYIGECFLKIATHLSFKPNFGGYTFRDDMISDGVENCLHRDTVILTMEYGPVRLVDVVGDTVTVKSRDGMWRPAVVKAYGRQPLYRYRFGSFNSSVDDTHQEVIATLNHRWFVTNRVNARHAFTGESGVVTDLRLGDWLESATTCEPRDPEGVIHGLIFGDGSINQKTTTYAGTTVSVQGREYPFMRVCKQDAVRDEICTILKDVPHTYPPSAAGDPVFYLGARHGLKSLPHGHDPAYIRGFVYGWWLADGTKTTTNRRLQISTINADAVEWLRCYAAFGGYCVISVRTTSGGGYANSKPLFTVTLAESSQYDARVRSIEYVGEDDVFCVEEPVTNGFVLANGLLTGNCLLYIHNFDPAKSSNPFGYFTQIIYYAFLRRIQKEKRHTYIKYKLLEKAVIDGDTADTPVNGGSLPVDTSMLSFDNVQQFITNYDEYSSRRRERRRVTKRKDEPAALDDEWFPV
jgi:hypothetical protein